MAKLVYGAYKSNKPEYFIKKLEELVWPDIQILPFDEGSAKTYTRPRVELEKKWEPLTEPELKVENWLQTF